MSAGDQRFTGTVRDGPMDGATLACEHVTITIPEDDGECFENHLYDFVRDSDGNGWWDRR